MQPPDLSFPTLPSRCLDDTLAFYETLGFEGERPADAYAVLRRGTVELHFFAHEALVPAESSAGCYIRVSDVDAVHEAFALAGLPRTGIPRQDASGVKPWGMKEFAVVDPDGNLIRIGQVLR